MVEITIALDSNGAIRHLQLDGHVSGPTKGENLACAAVSLMIRSVSRLLKSQQGWVVSGGVAKPGNLSLTIESRPEYMTKWLKGVTDTLLRALVDIDEEFPSALSVRIEEIHNGS